MDNVYIHPTADVSPKAVLGDGVRIWHQAQVREGAVLGRNCILGKGVYIDFGVHIGDNVKIQNRASVYHGVTIESGVFIGPHVIFTNDKLPRAVNPDGSLKSDDDWELGEILVREGASIGAGAIIVTGVTIGRWAMIGSGAVVTRDVPDYGLVYGNPARLHGYACPCGHKLEPQAQGGNLWQCPACGRHIAVGATGDGSDE
jgi:UDP-2-acetamido-3-amino-2,3-dideoxy-glucuronate N-acetyltransferase